MIFTGVMKNKEIIYKVSSVVLALLIWQGVSMLVGMEMLLASPVTVVKHLLEIIKEQSFLGTVLFSLVKIVSGFMIAFFFGFILAFLAHRFMLIEKLLWPYVITIKTVPIASFIILCLIWFSYGQITVFIAFLIVFPVIYSNILQGLKNTDTKMLELAKLYKMSWKRRFIYIYLPAVKPFLLSACSISVGMAWKAGVAAEVIGIVDNSIGERLYNSKIYFQNADLLAWTLIIVILSVLMEKLLSAVIQLAFSGLEKL